MAARPSLRRPSITAASATGKRAKSSPIRAARKTPVKTVLADGTKETENIAEPGDYIVTGKGRERWV